MVPLSNRNQLYSRIDQIQIKKHNKTIALLLVSVRELLKASSRLLKNQTAKNFLSSIYVFYYSTVLSFDIDQKEKERKTWQEVWLKTVFNETIVWAYAFQCIVFASLDFRSSWAEHNLCGNDLARKTRTHKHSHVDVRCYCDGRSWNNATYDTIQYNTYNYEQRIAWWRFGWLLLPLFESFF